MELAPVVLFVYNRPDHTKRILADLAKNELAKKTILFVFSDGAKKSDQIDKVNEVREIIKNFKNNFLVKNVIIEEASSNMGLANSVIQGITKVFQLNQKVIVLEDDLRLSVDFLVYMNRALDFYEKSNRIGSIAANTFDLQTLKKYSHDVYCFYRGSSWGWATWKDRWEDVDWDILDFQQFNKNKKQIEKFNRGGKDLSTMLTLQMEGKLDSWAIRWTYHLYKNDLLTIFPKYSRAINDGWDGSGTHCNGDGYGKIEDSMEKYEFVFEEIKTNRKICREYQRYFCWSLKKRVINKLQKFSIPLKGEK